MELRKKLRLYLLAGLLLCAPVAWGQSFGDQLIGAAVSCVQKSFLIDGSSGHYKLLDSAAAQACKGAGTATARSSANIGPPMTSAKAVTTRAKAGDGSASEAQSFDEAILNPPSGWSGSVPVELKTVYSFGVQGLVPPKTAGAIGISWIVTNVGVIKVNHTVNVDSNGQGEQKLSFRFNVDESNKSYTFALHVSGGAEATASKYGSPSAVFYTFPIKVALPQGWTCAWASGIASCGD